VTDADLDDGRRGDVDRALLGTADRQRRELLAIANQPAHRTRALALLGTLPPDHDALPSTAVRILQVFADQVAGLRRAVEVAAYLPGDTPRAAARAAGRATMLHG
jgi:hypothetical protein